LRRNLRILSLSPEPKPGGSCHYSRIASRPTTRSACSGLHGIDAGRFKPNRRSNGLRRRGGPRNLPGGKNRARGSKNENLQRIWGSVASVFTRSRSIKSKAGINTAAVTVAASLCEPRRGTSLATRASRVSTSLRRRFAKPASLTVSSNCRASVSGANRSERFLSHRAPCFYIGAALCG